MDMQLRADAEAIARRAIESVKPDAAVRRALENMELTGRVVLVAVGKAAWQMASAAVACLPERIASGIVVTKYRHVMGEIPGIRCMEAGHPVPDENSIRATEEVLKLTENLTQSDTVLFLLSGGGSALFEKPLIDSGVLQQVTGILLESGADITKINAIRKRLSAVKGGRFAAHCAPARVEAVILSDVLGDRLDVIASGPAAVDPTSREAVREIALHYRLDRFPEVMDCLRVELPSACPNVRSQIIGSVRQLCLAAEREAGALGYECIFLSDCLDGEAADTGRMLAAEIRKFAGQGRKIALLAGGETVVHVRGDGLGGRNQELALAAAQILDGIAGTALISVGSDGTDGPTDAAGGYADADTAAELAAKGIAVGEVLQRNDAYHALGAVGNLIVTGPTGTHVNDLVVGLIRE